MSYTRRSATPTGGCPIAVRVSATVQSEVATRGAAAVAAHRQSSRAVRPSEKRESMGKSYGRAMGRPFSGWAMMFMSNAVNVFEHRRGHDFRRPAGFQQPPLFEGDQLVAVLGGKV